MTFTENLLDGLVVAAVRERLSVRSGANVAELRLHSFGDEELVRLEVRAATPVALADSLAGLAGCFDVCHAVAASELVVDQLGTSMMVAGASLRPIGAVSVTVRLDGGGRLCEPPLARRYAGSESFEVSPDAPTLVASSLMKALLEVPSPPMSIRLTRLQRVLGDTYVRVLHANESSATAADAKLLHALSKSRFESSVVDGEVADSRWPVLRRLRS